MRYEPTSVCSTFGRRRACRATARSPLSARLYRAPLSDSAPQRPGAAPFPDRCCPELRCPNCPRRSAGFCPPRLGWPSATVQNAQNHPCRLVSRPRRRPARLAAPVPPTLRQADQPVDAAPHRPGLLREGLDTPPSQRREHPPGPQTPGRRLEAGQTLAGQPRSRVRAKKNCATG